MNELPEDIDYLYIKQRLIRDLVGEKDSGLGYLAKRILSHGRRVTMYVLTLVIITVLLYAFGRNPLGLSKGGFITVYKFVDAALIYSSNAVLWLLITYFAYHYLVLLNYVLHVFRITDPSPFRLVWNFPLLRCETEVSMHFFNTTGLSKAIQNHIVHDRRASFGLSFSFMGRGKYMMHATVKQRNPLFFPSPDLLTDKLTTILDASSLIHQGATKPRTYRYSRHVAVGHDGLSKLTLLVSELKRLDYRDSCRFTFDFPSRKFLPSVPYFFKIETDDREDLEVAIRALSLFAPGCKISHRPRLNSLPADRVGELIVLPHVTADEIAEVRQIQSRKRQIAPKTDSSPEDIVTRLKIGNVKIRNDFQYVCHDFTLGGLITGGIGTGKTTMRLHILDMLIANGVKIIDIDFKGDAPRFAYFRERGLVFAPKFNLQLNPFEPPAGRDIPEYIDQLTRALMETIKEEEGLTPPQQRLLYMAVKRTVELSGNAFDFFENISRIALSDSKIIDNKQDHTAIALFNKFQWIQSTMRDIFWVPHSNITPRTFLENNVFIDLSKINDTVPVEQMRFLIDLILMNLTIGLKDLGEQIRLDKDGNRIPKHVILLDEGQYLVPRKNSSGAELSRLEEIISTFRYKGVAVVASGVSAELMSPILADSGFIAQFRTESEFLGRALGLSDTLSEVVPKLMNFHAIVKAQSTNQEPVLVKTTEFSLEKDPEQEYWRTIKKQDTVLLSTLPNFSIDVGAKILRDFMENVNFNVPRPRRTILELDAKEILKKVSTYSHSDLFGKGREKRAILIEELCGSVSSFYSELSLTSRKFPSQFRDVLLILLFERFLHDWRLLVNSNRGFERGLSREFVEMYYLMKEAIDSTFFSLQSHEIEVV